ncbi:NADH-ubiquinone oxidoreductase-F iron-sulfur binding region domain-containing protein [Mycobacterium sp. 3519A]|uniref:NADH-ubiquinone oxidoreductase-F iron-sulfur binding region domain-containing protein n=1 Tax=Mycobacterium sp. 3519A TaxID=2057184 RepID=UPI001F1D254D|nr:NADH-ubiquinone oxidoreductase-F iron-sulfur binding region domain-containing protein [Mycobacterium sp. 3519A]
MTGAELISAVDAAGLRGRGGAGFSAGRKIASVNGNKSVVVANGAEGEPLSRKDAVVLTRAPHLMLDGLELAAGAVGATKVYLYVPTHVVATAERALSERRAAKINRHNVTVVEAPNTFVAGEESALVRRIEGGPALPRDRKVVTAVSGVRRKPTLVNNVETLAQMALISRFGPDWFRSVGAADNPGSMLVTLSGAIANPGVFEVPTGAVLADVIEQHGATDPTTVRAVLVGGYHGTWVTGHALGNTPVSGTGIVHALGGRECGLDRTAMIAEYLAGQSARQCGPCLNGLPRLAYLLNELASDRAQNTHIREIRRLVDLVDGRGSCRHPDGTARLIRSALTTFADDIDHHRHRRCEVGVEATRR